jgi:hypothetical protein
VVTGTQPAQPTLACWQSATFNNTTCQWVVTGTQPPAPTGLACYQTATFNNTTCQWVVTGTQPPAPTGLACYQTATFNNTTCQWVVTGTPVITTQTEVACESYTWSVNDVTYTASTDVSVDIDCHTYILHLTINTPTTWYLDFDGDGSGDAGNSTLACSKPAGYVSNDDDCDDNSAELHPVAWYRDTDGDGFGNAATSVMSCNQPDGYVSDNTDCNDSNINVHPGATEVCGNGIDDNCNGTVDEGCNTIVRCTYTQGYYGNKNGNSCDGVTAFSSPANLIKYLLGVTTTPVALNPIVVGSGTRTVTVPASAAGATDLNSVMPGGSTPIALTFNGNVNVATTGQFKTSYLTSQGRINNILLSQTITLALNVRMNSNALASFPIRTGWLTTQKRNGCGSGATSVSCTSDAGAIRSLQMPSSVANYLTNFGANAATVTDLLNLANAVLGKTLTPGTAGANGNIVPSFGDVNNAADVINNAFDQCRMVVGTGYFTTQQSCFFVKGAAADLPVAVLSAEVKVYPNPSPGRFTIMLDNARAGKTNIVITDVSGRLIYNHEVNAVAGKQPVNINLKQPQGVYFIKIMDKDGMKTTKVVID